MFINFLMDAYNIAPNELSEILIKCQSMLDHTWNNNDGKAAVVLHRTDDHSIRHGWNPNGGEDGYYPKDLGTILAQGQALRAWGVVAYYSYRDNKNTHLRAY